MSRVLITGVQGFVGSHLARHLHSIGQEVFDLRVSGRENNFFQGELTDRSVFKQVLDDVKPDVIFHLAGVIKSLQSEVLHKAIFLAQLLYWSNGN